MKRAAVPFLLIACLLPAGCGGGDLYVSPRGDDAHPGTWLRPLRSLSAAAETLQPGQTCIVAGGVYRETLRPARSGRAGAPIRIVAADGQRVVISGADIIEGWQHDANGVWRARIDAPIRQLFADGEIMTLARHPNSGDELFEPNTLDMQATPAKITAKTGLDQPAGTWKGATLWGMDKTRGWVAHTYTVADSKPGVLLFDPPRKGWWKKGPGRGFLFNAPAALDAPGEWYADGNAVYFIPPDGRDPRKMTVTAARRRWAIDLSARSHVELVGIDVRAGGVNVDANHCLIDRMDARWVNLNAFLRGGFNRDRAINARSEGLGVALGGEGNVLRNSTIACSWGDGVSVFGRNNRVENCAVHHVNFSASDCAPVNCTGEGHVVTRCTLHDGGRSILVHRYLSAGRITHNHMYNAGRMSRDLGMTYTYHTDGNGTIISHNRIHSNFAEGWGCVGIYLDDRSRRHVVHHNVVYGVSEALAINPPDSKHNLLINNTLDGWRASLSFSTRRPQDTTGTRVANNIFTNRCMDVEKYGGSEDHNLREGTDPHFVNRKQADYRLQADSPAVDAGAAIPPYTDGFAGEAPDIGARERGAKPWSAGASEDVLKRSSHRK